MADNYWTTLSKIAKDDALPKEVVRGRALAWNKSYRPSKPQIESRAGDQKAKHES